MVFWRENKSDFSEAISAWMYYFVTGGLLTGRAGDSCGFQVYVLKLHSQEIHQRPTTQRVNLKIYL